MSDEAWLMLVVAALYLGDSLLFLAPDEAVLVRHARSDRSADGSAGRGWHARFGLDRWRLAGKEPYLPNPLLPHRPLFRLRWQLDAAPAEAAPEPAVRVAVPAVLERFRVHALASLGCIFVLLPAALLAARGIAWPIAVVALFYVNVTVAMVRLYRARAAFGLDRNAFLVLAFESAACPPFSINLVRKLCARLKVDEDFAAAAKRLLPPAPWSAAAAQCLRRVEEQIDYAAEGSVRSRNLAAARARFAAIAAAAPHEPDQERM